AVIRPFSGSGALGYYEELCENLESGSFAEKVASVLMGGSETTFYTLAVYFGAVGIKKSRNTVPAALSADIAAAILSVFAVNLFMR
ncbi:MAG: spore maturation protein, partial [Oscillospiraceae bacterium]|nr:spore maturation protein [Oscillospiraceae bacterium]